MRDCAVAAGRWLTPREALSPGYTSLSAPRRVTRSPVEPILKLLKMAGSDVGVGNEVEMGEGDKGETNSGEWYTVVRNSKRKKKNENVGILMWRVMSIHLKLEGKSFR